MFFIHKAFCISPQQTFSEINIEALKAPQHNILKAIEPNYDGLSPNALRRMSKSVRMAVGVAMPLLSLLSKNVDGILMGTGNASMEETGKFLDQVIEYSEGMLTPGNFVQSSPNAIAAQISMLTKNNNYNITHVHKGLAFENVLLDAAMLLKERESSHYLIGGVDECASYHYRLDYQNGFLKKEEILDNNFYKADSEGSIEGEGAAMFVVSNNKENALSKLQSLSMLHSYDVNEVSNWIKGFLLENVSSGEKIDLLLSGENGDCRHLKYYLACENLMSNHTSVARFKHICGEYSTASSFALWIAANTLSGNLILPEHSFKSKNPQIVYENVLIYNNYREGQHSLILVKK